jgi:hypothetical protein
MSVYEETGAGYLIRIKDLNRARESLASRARDEVVSPRQQSLTTYA